MHTSKYHTHRKKRLTQRTTSHRGPKHHVSKLHTNRNTSLNTTPTRPIAFWSNSKPKEISKPLDISNVNINTTCNDQTKNSTQSDRDINTSTTSESLTTKVSSSTQTTGDLATKSTLFNLPQLKSLAEVPADLVKNTTQYVKKNATIVKSATESVINATENVKNVTESIVKSNIASSKQSLTDLTSNLPTPKGIVTGATTTIVDQVTKTTKKVIDSSIDMTKDVSTKIPIQIVKDSITKLPQQIKEVQHVVVDIPLQFTKDLTTKIPTVAGSVISSTTQTITSTTQTITSSVGQAVTSTTQTITSSVGQAVAPLTRFQLSQLQLLKLNSGFIKGLIAGIIPSILSKTTNVLPIPSIQAAIYTALMLFHRHDKLLSSLNSPSIISQDLSSNLQLLTAVSTSMQRHNLVNYYNLFRSEPWVSKSSVIFLQRYLYFAIASYRTNPLDAVQLASRSGLDVELLHTSLVSTHITPDSTVADAAAQAKPTTQTTSPPSSNKDASTNGHSTPLHSTKNVNTDGQTDAHSLNTNNTLDNNDNRHIDDDQTLKLKFKPAGSHSNTPGDSQQQNQKVNTNDSNPSPTHQNEPSASKQEQESNKKDKEKAKVTPIPFLPEVPFYIFEDKTNGNIVVSIRGTDNLDDLVTDLISWPRQFQDSYVHSGFFSVAQKILPRVLTALREILISKYLELGIITHNELGLDEINLNDEIGNQITTKPDLSKVQFSFKDKPIPRIVFVGHSMGAACGSLMALICRTITNETDTANDEGHEPYPSPLGNDIEFIAKHYPLNDPFNNNLELVRALNPETISYASPAVVSPMLSEQMKDFAITVLNSDDPIPHLSEYSINNFLGELIKDVLTRDSNSISHDANTTTSSSSSSSSTLDSNPIKNDSTQSHISKIPANLSLTQSFDPFISVAKQQEQINEELAEHHEKERVKAQKNHSVHFSVCPDGFVEYPFDPYNGVSMNGLNFKRRIHRGSKPIPKYVAPPTALSKVTSYIPAVVDASLRFNRMFNPAMFVKSELTRHAKSYVKSKAVNYATGLAKGAISSQIKAVYQDATSITYRRRSKRRKFPTHNINSVNQSPLLDDDLSSESETDHLTPSSRYCYADQPVIMDIYPNDLDQSNPITTWNFALHPYPHQIFNTIMIDNAPDHEPITMKAETNTFDNTARINPTPTAANESLTTSLDKLASEFTDFFHKYKTILQNHIEPSLYSALATLPIAPKEPRRTINPTHISYATSGSKPSQQQQQQQPPPINTAQATPPSDSHTTIDNAADSKLASVLPAQHQLDEEEDIHKTPLDAIIPVPLTPEAFHHSFGWLKQPKFRNRVLYDDLLYKTEFGLDHPRGIWQMDQDFNIMGRMDVPGNVFYLKRIHKEVYLGAHLPIMVDAPTDAPTGDENLDNTITPETKKDQDSKPKMLTTIASQVLSKYYNSINTQYDPIATKHKELDPTLTTDATTWYINPITGLVNLGDQAINEYKLNPAEGMCPRISLPSATASTPVSTPNDSITMADAKKQSDVRNENITDQDAAIDPSNKLDSEWTKPISFQGGFKHPTPIFPRKLSKVSQDNNDSNLDGLSIHDGDHDTTNIEIPRNFPYIQQDNELIQRLLKSTDGPALPLVTPLTPSTNVSDPTTSKPASTDETTKPIPINTELGASHDNINPPQNVVHLHENRTSLRRRSQFIINFFNSIADTIVTGDIASVTLANLKSLSHIQKQIDSVKSLNKQEYVRLMVRRPAHEFSSIMLTEHMIFDHPSRAYISGFEECLGNDTITISPTYSHHANLPGLFSMAPPTDSQTPSNSISLTSTKPNKTTKNNNNNNNDDDDYDDKPSSSPPPPTGGGTPNTPQGHQNNFEFVLNASHQIQIDSSKLTKLVLGAKVDPSQIFSHHHNSIRSLLPSLTPNLDHELRALYHLHNAAKHTRRSRPVEYFSRDNLTI